MLVLPTHGFSDQLTRLDSVAACGAHHRVLKVKVIGFHIDGPAEVAIAESGNPTLGRGLRLTAVTHMGGTLNSLRPRLPLVTHH
jgi:hypothetical protein